MVSGITLMAFAVKRMTSASLPGVTETKMWGAYEKVSVRRVTAEEGKR